MGKRDKEIVVVVTKLSKSESLDMKHQLIQSVKTAAPKAKGEIRNVGMSSIGEMLMRLNKRY